VEILKQGQYVPEPFERQIAVIFAGTNGVLDKIPVSVLNRFEKEMLDYLEMKYPDILPAIAEEKVLSDELREKLLNAVTRFAENFKYEEE